MLWELLLLGICVQVFAAPGSALCTAWNFAYGSNLDYGTRERRGLQPHRLVPARVHGWELTFGLQGVPYIEPAFAALCPAPPHSDISAHGLCLELDQEGWLQLLLTESVLDANTVAQLRFRDAPLDEVLRVAVETSLERRRGYRLKEVRVEPYGGDTTSSPTPSFLAYTLAACDSDDAHVADKVMVSQMMPPSERYWRLIRNGAARHKLNRDYRAYLASLPRYSPSALVLAAVPAAIVAAPVLAVIAVSVAISRRLGLAAQEAQSERRWPALRGPSAVLKGRLIIGTDPRPGIWSSFCSVPRADVVSVARELVGDV